LSRKVIHWPLLSASLIEISASDSLEVDLSASNERVAITLESSGATPRLLGSSKPDLKAAQGPISIIPPNAGVRLVGAGTAYLRHLVLEFALKDIAFQYDAHPTDYDVDAPHLCFTDPRLMRIARLIEDECRAPSSPASLYVDSLSLAFFSALPLRRQKRQASGGLSPHQLQKVTTFLEAHAFTDVLIQDLADLIDLSPSYFCKAFRTSTGTTPHQWQLNMRIEHAKTLMLTTNQSLGDIAISSGFCSQAHFTRAFNQRTGSNPLQWRKGRRGG
jgi:AraC family transcriptional regulator